MLFGKSVHTVDVKGRVMIPSKMREELGSKVYLLRGFEGCLSVYKESEFQTYIATLGSLAYTQKSARDIQRLAYSSMDDLEIDKQGRIQIPVQTIREFNIAKEVVIVGVINHLEIWNKDAWEKYESENSSKFEEIAESLPL